MREFLPTVLFIAAASAAPAPRNEPPEFGANGLLTAADLKAVVFNSRITTPAEELKALKLRPGERPEDYDVALHLPRTRFLCGEPIPAYFVVKNNRGSPIEIDGRLDFTGNTPVCVNSFRLTFRRRDGKPFEAAVLQQSQCGSPWPLVQIPEHGLSVTRGDLNQLAKVPLPEGEYQVEWSCQMRASAPVSFKVLPWTGSGERPKKSPMDHLRFVSIEPDDPEAGDEDGFFWRDFELTSIASERMSAALSCGPFGKYVPDVRTIPSTDGRLSVSASLREEDRGFKLIIELKSADPRREVAFEEPPHVYLQLEERDAGERRERRDRSARDLIKRAEMLRFKTPLTIEVPFDADHWVNAGFGPGRLAVLVTSGKLEFPSRVDREAIRQARDSVVRPSGEESWKGVLRSGFIPLNQKPARE